MSRLSLSSRSVGPPTEIPMARLARFSAPDQSKLAVFKKNKLSSFPILKQSGTVTNKFGTSSEHVNQFEWIKSLASAARWFEHPGALDNLDRCTAVTRQSHDIPWHSMTCSHTSWVDYVSDVSVVLSQGLVLDVLEGLTDSFNHRNMVETTPKLMDCRSLLQLVEQSVAACCSSLRRCAAEEACAKRCQPQLNHSETTTIWQIMTTKKEQYLFPIYFQYVQ